MAKNSEMKLFVLKVKDDLKRKEEPEWVAVVAETPGIARELARRPQIISSPNEVGEDVKVPFNPWSKENSAIHDITEKYPQLLEHGKGVLNVHSMEFDTQRDIIDG